VLLLVVVLVLLVLLILLVLLLRLPAHPLRADDRRHEAQVGALREHRPVAAGGVLFIREQVGHRDGVIRHED